MSSLRREKYIDVIKDLENFELIKGKAKFIFPAEVEVDGKTVSGDKILIAAGASPFIPEIEGLSDTPYLTNESARDKTRRHNFWQRY